MNLKVVGQNEFVPSILYKNLRRTEVDALFEKKYVLQEEIRGVKTLVHGGNLNSSQKEEFKNIINKKNQKITELDIKARQLWKTIKETAAQM